MEYSSKSNILKHKIIHYGVQFENWNKTEKVDVKSLKWGWYQKDDISQFCILLVYFE